MSNMCRFSIPSFRSNIYYDAIFEESVKDPLQHLKEFIDQCFEKSRMVIITYYNNYFK